VRLRVPQLDAVPISSAGNALFKNATLAIDPPPSFKRPSKRNSRTVAYPPSVIAIASPDENAIAEINGVLAGLPKLERNGAAEPGCGE
jgi:hypothetical protein